MLTGGTRSSKQVSIATAKKLVGQWQKKSGKFFMGTTHILSAAAHPKNACSFQMGHHLEGTKQAFQWYKIYCQKP
jgi:hypothetical protein